MPRKARGGWKASGGRGGAGIVRDAPGHGTQPRARSYRHPEAESPMRPDVGTQPQFKKKKPPQTYRYDSSLSPALDWDGQNPTREQGEALIREMLDAPSLERAKTAAVKLKAMGSPFLNWAGKAERLSFTVPTLPLFVHERLSTKAIIETLKGHKRDKQETMFDLFGDPQHSVTDQVLRAYEHRDKWVNRLILGDSLVVMNSLLHYEGLGGQVQMIYMDPPYGVKFGSNFQPFVRKRDVKHNDDVEMTREPEMVQAYRDTWELGLHSYLSYLRDRLFLCRDLLDPSGSVFVQIGDENLHLVRAIADEVFGADNFIAVIPFRKKTMPLGARHLEGICDYLIWYSRDIERLHFNRLYLPMDVQGDPHWNYVELPDGGRRKMTKEEINNHGLLPAGATPFQLMSLYPVGVNATGLFSVNFRGRPYSPPEGNSWFTNPAGMARLIAANRIEPYEDGETLRYVLKLSDGSISQMTNMWADTSAPSDKMYAVQTSTKVIERCVLMTTKPGDLVLDPTCGSGTTAYVAERWGRRWITIDTSRVPLALVRQRLLTATYPWYALKDDARGPAGGLEYLHKTDARARQTGGIVHGISRGTIANEEPPEEIVLVDRPEAVGAITRVSGPFTVEASIPVPVDRQEEESTAGLTSGADGTFVDRMLEALRRAPVLRMEGNKTVALKNVRPPAKTLSLSAEAVVTNGGEKAVAFVFGPENGAVSERLVYEAAREANAKNYTHLYVIGFAIQPNARVLIEKCAEVVGIPATYVQATPDLLMGDLLKNMRSSQIFSVCGLPEITLKRLKAKVKNGGVQYQVSLVGLDVFDPVTMDVDHRDGDDVPAWFLDTDYNGLCFHVSQAFFPKTGAWESLKKALKADYDETVWDHLAGSDSAPFEAGEHGQIAVKVIDERGNELLVVESLKEAKG